MYAGLIPVVTREAGINTEDFGVTLANDGLEVIEKTVLELAELPKGWHVEHSIRTRKTAERKFSEDFFICRWRQIIGVVSEGMNERRARC